MKSGVSYFGNRIPKHVREDLQDMVDHGVNFVVHTFAEEDLQFYRRTMGEIVKITHEVGLEVYLDPWGVGGIFGGESYSNFVATNLDARQVLADGSLAPAACLNNPGFRQFMREWVSAGAEVGADVLFWDEPHFYVAWESSDQDQRQWACRCQSCQDLYQKRYSSPMPQHLTQEVQKFKQASVVDFLGEMCNLSHQLGMKNAICLLPHENINIGITDWSEVARIESVDVFGTDPYWIGQQEGVEELVRRFSRRVRQICDRYGKEPQIWIQAFKIPAGREKEVATAVRIAYDEGIRNLAAWSYLGGEYMSCIRSDHPSLVWEILGDAYKDCLQREGETPSNRVD